MKTGYTEAAGRCYVITQRVGGHELGVVLLNTPNPIDQVPALLRAGAKFEQRWAGKRAEPRRRPSLARRSYGAKS